ncbi:MAG: hypothetical protein Q9O24_02660 [Gammaproteobacteria bacterium]|nr:hypothetical protein [Gammaproteobacteria bacterium]
MAFLLADFSPLLGVSFGMNVVFSLWSELHNSRKETHNKLCLDFIENLDIASTDLSPRVIANAEKKLRKANMEAVQGSDKLSLYGQRYGAVAAFVIASLLFMIGVNPTFSIGWFGVVVMIATVVLPVPLLLLYFRHHWSKKHSELTKTLADIAEIFDTAPPIPTNYTPPKQL